MPLKAKILALTPHYATLVLDLPHSSILDVEAARSELVREADAGAFDPTAVRAFLRILDREDDRCAAASDGRFALTGESRRTEGGDTTLRRLGLAW